AQSRLTERAGGSSPVARDFWLRKKYTLKTPYRLRDGRLIHQEGNCSFRSTLAEQPCLHIRKCGEGAAGDLRPSSSTFSNQANQCSVVLPSQIGHALQLRCDSRQV